MSNDERIKEYMARGMTKEQACGVLGVPYVPDDAPSSYDKDTLRAMAIDTLASLVNHMNINPRAYKPNEVIAACKEALDRTEGKPLQTAQVNSNVSYNIIAAIPAAPNSLARPDVIDVDCFAVSD